MNLLLVDDSEMTDFAAATPEPLAELPGPVFSIAPEAQSALLAERNYMPLGLPLLRVAQLGTRNAHGTADQYFTRSHMASAAPAGTGFQARAAELPPAPARWIGPALGPARQESLPTPSPCRASAAAFRGTGSMPASRMCPAARHASGAHHRYLATAGWDGVAGFASHRRLHVVLCASRAP